MYQKTLLLANKSLDIFTDALFFVLRNKLSCGYDVIGVAWQTSALSVRVRVPLSAYYISYKIPMLGRIVTGLFVV